MHDIHIDYEPDIPLFPGESFLDFDLEAIDFLGSMITPDETKKRTVVFGGHDTFLKAFRPKFPNVRFVDASQLNFSPEIVRNADVVWIQNNRISHSQYYGIINAARKHGIQVRYFPYTSAEKCAVLMAMEDEK